MTAVSAATSRRPPWASFRSGSSRNPTSPKVRCRSTTWSARTPSHGGLCFAHRSRARFEHRLGHLGIAADDPAVEEAERDPKVARGHVEHITRASDAVIERDSLVPYRVPDPVGGGRDVPPAPVQEHDVEVAERAELSPAVATHRGQRHSPAVPLGGTLEQAGKPLVGRFGVGVAERVASQVAALDERLAQGTQGHGRTVPPGNRRTAPTGRRWVTTRFDGASITLGSWPEINNWNLALKGAAG